MREGCRFRIVLLDPTSPALKTWNDLVDVLSTESDIKNVLVKLIEMKKGKGKCEVRLSKVFLPFRLLMTDPNKITGSVIIEFYTYKTPLGDRPHVQLSHLQDQHWFNFYKTQFEQIWSEAESWTPQPSVFAHRE